MLLGSVIAIVLVILIVLVIVIVIVLVLVIVIVIVIVTAIVNSTFLNRCLKARLVPSDSQPLRQVRMEGVKRNHGIEEITSSIDPVAVVQSCRCYL